jgi:catalase (peroxidase I)
MNWYTRNILQVLEPVKRRYGAALSWADLIVLAGNAAIESAGGQSMTFCGGRSDALDANGTEHLGPRKYSTPLIEVLDSFKVMGLTQREGVALSARLRSPIHMRRLGYTGSWSTNPFKLSNEYFKTLINETWQLMIKPPRGMAEFKAAGKPLYMLPTDIALKQDSQLLAIAKEFAADNTKFLQAFAAAWTKMMNADRFNGPAGTVCPP